MNILILLENDESQINTETVTTLKKIPFSHLSISLTCWSCSTEFLSVYVVQNVVWGPAASASSRSLIEMHSLRLLSIRVCILTRSPGGSGAYWVWESLVDTISASYLFPFFYYTDLSPTWKNPSSVKCEEMGCHLQGCLWWSEREEIRTFAYY